MILKSLSLESWRCILKPVSLGPFSRQINIIYAANGTGKSSLFEALQRAVFDSHQVSGRLMEQIRPWGRDLAPKVTVEFVRDGVEYRLTKRFLIQPFASLERREGNQFQPFKEGRRADEFVRGLFSDTSPGRGLSKPEHHGLCQVLWTPQGGIELGAVRQAVVADIRQALGVQVSRTMGGPIEEEIEKRYLRYFTRTGKLKTGQKAPELVRLKEEKRELEAKRRRLVSRQQDLEQARIRLEDLRAETKVALGQTDKIRQQVNRAKRRCAQYLEVKNRLETARQKARAAEARYQALADRIDRVKAAEKEIAGLEEEIKKLEAGLKAAAGQVRLHRKKHRDCRDKLKELEEEKRRIKQLGRQVELARDFVQAGQKLAGYQKRLADLQACEQELAAARSEQAGVVAPDRKALRRIRKLESGCRKLKAEIENSMIRLEIEPRQDLEFALVKGRDEGGGRLKKGRKITFRGPGEVVVELADVARLRARGPGGDLDRLEARLEKDRAALGKLTRPFGTSDPDRLQELLDRAEVLAGRVQGLEQKRNLLAQDGDAHSLRGETAKCSEVIRHVLEQFPSWDNESPDLVELESRYATALGKHEQRFKAAGAEEEQSRKALEGAFRDEDRFRTRLESKRSECNRARVRLDQIRQDGLSQQARKDELIRLAMKRDAVLKPVPELERNLQGFGSDPARELEDLEEQLKAGDQEERRLRDSEKTAEGRVAELTRQAPYSKLAACEERLADIESRIAVWQLRLDAIALLHDTVGSLRSGLTDKVLQPLEKMAGRLLERIGGPGVGRVVLDEDLKPAFVEPVVAGRKVDLENLSGGENEQLHFVCRLALAEVLATEQPQLLVLDDVLTATDTGRLTRILRILKEMRPRLQVIILTCHPRRYAALDGAARFDLEKIIPT